MKNQIILVAAVVASAVVSAGAFAANVNKSDKDKVVALLSSIETGDPEPIAYINAENYIQHNQAVGDGLAGFGEALQALPKGSARVDVKRVFQDGKFVFTHTDYNFFGPKVGFDVFRFEDGLIVEHWDNLAAKADKPNPSGRTQLDGATELLDIEKTGANKAVVEDFVDSVLIKGAFDQLPEFINTETYLQHNTDIGDGLDGLGAAIEALAAQGIQMVYTRNHKVLGEGNFVLSISEGIFGEKSVSYYDLFRLEQGLIVEHWDVIEPLMPEAGWKNQNGKFGGL